MLRRQRIRLDCAWVGSIPAALAATALIYGVTCSYGWAAPGASDGHSAAQAVVGVELNEGDWPWWRGPQLDGKSTGDPVPTEWDEQKNVIWKVAVPGQGHSSPIVCGQAIFLTTADENAKKISMLAVDRTSGRKLWQTPLYQGELMTRHSKNSHASATAACDGRRLYVSFIAKDSLNVAAIDVDGKVAWQKAVDPFVSQHGYGASPVLYKSLVIVSGDHSGPGHLIALDRTTGNVVWRTNRGKLASYSTPIIGRLAGRSQVLLSGCDMVAGYDPDTGSELWRVKGPTDITACTMAFGDDIAYASGGFPGKGILAIRADGSGDVTDTHVVWQATAGVTYVPSPLYDDGRLYMVSDQGIAQAFDGRSGKVLWKHRLGGNFTASPVLAGGNLYVANEEGSTFVFAAGPKFKQLAENKLPEAQFATMAICGGRIYLRTVHHLYAIGK